MNAEERKGKVAEMLWNDPANLNTRELCHQAAQAIDEFYEADKKAEIRKAIPEEEEIKRHWNEFLTAKAEGRNEVIAELRKSLLGGEDDD